MYESASGSIGTHLLHLIATLLVIIRRLREGLGEFLEPLRGVGRQAIGRRRIVIIHGAGRFVAHVNVVGQGVLLFVLRQRFGAECELEIVQIVR